jgi:hypothetical protein
MKRFSVFVIAAALAVLVRFSLGQNPPAPVAGAAPAVRTAIRIGFGERQERVTDYSGSLTLSEGRVVELIPYRFFGGDQMAGANGWTLTTRVANMENQPDQPRPVLMAGANQNIVPKAVSAIVEAPAGATVTAQTRRGTYTFRLDALANGRVLSFEDGDVLVQAVPGRERVSAPFPAGNPDAWPDNDYPSLTTAADGSAWAAWQIYEKGGDRVVAAHSTDGGWSAAEALTPPGQDVFRTAIAQDSAGVIWAVWSQREGEAWDLVARTYDGRGWSAARKLTNGNGPNFFHKLTRGRDGTLHLVWVAHLNSESHVMWSRLAGGQWSAPREVSGASAWMPDAAADSKGNLYVAWDSYRTGNYDIFLRRINADGSMEAVQQVTRSSRFQAHASLAVDGSDRVWLAWDESGSNWGKDFYKDGTWQGTVLYADRRPRIAVLQNGTWMEPAADPMAAMPRRFNRFVENPRLAADASGRIWLLLNARTFAAMNRSDFWANNGRWDLFLTCLEGDHWRDAAQIPQSSTRPDGPVALAGSGAGVWAVWTNDNRQMPAAAGTPNRRHNEIDFFRVDGAAAVPNPALAAFSEPPATAGFVHPHEAADVRQIRDYRSEAGGVTRRIMRGDFHRHTEISPDGAGDGSLDDYFRYMIDAAAMDTGIVSDHNAGLDEYTWWRTEKAIDLYHIPGGYTPLFGYERSVPYPNGHRNVVFDHRGVKVLPISQEENQNRVNTGPILYPYLKQNRGIAMPHSMATDQGTDYRDNDPEVEPLVEIYQGFHANYEYAGAPRAESDDYHVETHGPYRPQGYYWNALAKGLKLGTESSSDHISTHASYTMIYTPTGLRRDMVESMRQRHAYGATDNIVLDFRLRTGDGKEAMMGDTVDGPGVPVLRVKVVGTARMEAVEIIKDGKFIYKTDTGDFEFTDPARGTGTSWYYVRVQQADRNMAWSSPIWVNWK